MRQGEKEKERRKKKERQNTVAVFSDYSQNQITII